MSSKSKDIGMSLILVSSTFRNLMGSTNHGSIKFSKWFELSRTCIPILINASFGSMFVWDPLLMMICGIIYSSVFFSTLVLYLSSNFSFLFMFYRLFISLLSSWQFLIIPRGLANFEESYSWHSMLTSSSTMLFLIVRSWF